MTYIERILKKPWSVLFAFIPIINLLYIIIRFCTPISRNVKMPLCVFPIVLIPGCILYRMLPEAFGWLVTHLMISAFTAIFLSKDRKVCFNELQFNTKKAITNLPWFVALVLMIWLLPMLSTAQNLEINIRPNLTEKTRIALNAIVNNNNDDWLASVHQGEGKFLNDLDIVKENIIAKGINIDEGYRFTTGESDTISTTKTDNGTYYRMEKHITVDGKRHLLRVIWLEGETESGFVQFDFVN